MNKITRCIIVGLVFSVMPMQAHAITLSLEPSSNFIFENDPVSLDLVISGLDAGGPNSLGAFSLYVRFSALALRYDSVEFGHYLGDTDPMAFETSVYVDDTNATAYPSMVYLDEVSFLFDWELDMLQSDSFTLATLNFTGAAPSFSLVSIYNVVLSDAFGYQLPAPTLVRAGITVPEPPTVVLISMAWLGLVSVVRQQNRQKARCS